jgi:hypothetical protein
MHLFELSEATAARRRFPVYLVDATDGLTPETGEAGGQPQIQKSGGAWANTSATLSAIGNGAYYVELTQAELDTLGDGQIRYKSANTAEFNMPFQVVAFDPYDAAALGLTRIDVVLSTLSTAANLALAAADVTTLLGRLTGARAGYLDNLNVGGNVASAAQATAIETDTQDIQNRLPAALVGGRMASIAEVLGVDSVDANALKADAVTEIVTAIFARVIDTLTVNQIFALLVAAMAGKTNGMDTGNGNIRNIGDTVNRIQSTHDGVGNRTAIAFDLTGV